jgi:hypothetical protein
MMGNYEYTPTFRAWAAIETQGAQAWYSVLAQADPLSKGVSQGAKDKRAMRHGLRYILQHPMETMKRDLVKLANFWGLEREVLAGVARGVYGDLPGWHVAGLTAAILGAYIGATLLGVFGAWTVPSAQPRAQAFVVLVMAVLCGAHTLTFGHSRYHLPLMPLVLIFAAAAIVQRDLLRAAVRTWPFRAALAMAGLLVVVWAVELAVVYRENAVELLNAIV